MPSSTINWSTPGLETGNRAYPFQESNEVICCTSQELIEITLAVYPIEIPLGLVADTAISRS